MRRPNAALRVALVAAAVYLALSAAWILYSDTVVMRIADDLAELRVFQTWKGLAFVLVTALVGGVAVWWYEARQWRDESLLRQAFERSRRTRRIAATLLAESEARFRTFLDNSPVLAWTTSRDRRVTWASAGLRNATDGSPDPVGRSLDQVFGPVVAARLWEPIESILKVGRTAVSLESLPLDDAENSHFVVQRFVVGDDIGFAAVDVSGQIRAEEFLESATRAGEDAELRAELDSFVYAVSHDLRAPLRAMTGFANALLEEYHSRFDDDGRRYLVRIVEAAETMGAQVDGLLELSRVSRAEIVPGEFDAADFIRSEARRLTRGAPERRIELDVPERLVVRGDPRLMREAFRRLMDNAWKFSAGRNPARISLRGDGNTVTLSDDGVGFDPAYAHKLFTPFQRLHSQAEFPGAGIGLVIVQRILRRHGGRIRLESRAGMGTSVVIELGAEDNG